MRIETELERAQMQRERENQERQHQENLIRIERMTAVAERIAVALEKLASTMNALK